MLRVFYDEDGNSTGSFINADNYELVSQLAGSKELNMYAYCRNNPIMYTDETGEGWILALVIIGVGALIGGGDNDSI